MTWARVSSVCVGVAVAMILVAYAPPVLTDPFSTAVAQIRANATASALLIESATSSEMTKAAETSAKKTK